MGLLNKVFQTQPREHWIGIFEKNGHPCGPVHTYKEVRNSHPYILGAV